MHIKWLFELLAVYAGMFGILVIFGLSWNVYTWGYYSKNKKIKFLSRLCGFIVAFGILQCLK